MTKNVKYLQRLNNYININHEKIAFSFFFLPKETRNKNHSKDHMTGASVRSLTPPLPLSPPPTTWSTLSHVSFGLYCFYAGTLRYCCWCKKKLHKSHSVNHRGAQNWKFSSQLRSCSESRRSKKSGFLKREKQFQKLI